MIAETIPELKSLTLEEKLILVSEIWDGLAAQPNAFLPREDHISPGGFWSPRFSTCARMSK